MKFWGNWWFSYMVCKYKLGCYLKIAKTQRWDVICFKRSRILAWLMMPSLRQKYNMLMKGGEFGMNDTVIQ